MAGLTQAIRPDHVAIYIRWSTEDQGDGTTLVVQQEGCQHYLLSQGWRVTPSLIFIDDGCSGGSLNRPKLAELRLAIKAGEVDCVVVYKLDRLSRSVMDTVNLVLGEWDGRTFLKSAREPIDTTTAMGKQFFYMLVSYAEWERGVIKERTFSGKQRRAREGRYTGGPVPLGYRLSGEKGLLETDPQQCKLIRRIFDRYLDEVGTYRIADELNRDGIPSPTGRKWHVNTLLKILRNPLYAGQLVYGRKPSNPRRQRNTAEPWYLNNPDPIRAQSQAPALILPEQFERVQTLLAQRGSAKVGMRALSSEYLLTGLLTCRCGAAMVSHSTVRRPGMLYAYYLCQGKKGRGSAACSAGLIRQQDLDRIVEQELEELLQSEEAHAQFLSLRWASLEEQLHASEERRRLAHAGLEGLKAQTKRINHDYRCGVLPAPLYEENRREIDAQTSQLQEQLRYLEGLERSLAAQLRERDSLCGVFDLARRWQELAVPQRKFVLRNLMDGVEAFKPMRSHELSVRVIWKFRDPGSREFSSLSS